MRSSIEFLNSICITFHFEFWHNVLKSKIIMQFYPTVVCSNLVSSYVHNTKYTFTQFQKFVKTYSVHRGNKILEFYMRSATSSGSPFWLMIKFARLPVAKSLLNRRAIPPRGVLLCTPGTMGPGGDRGDIFSKVA